MANASANLASNQKKEATSQLRIRPRLASEAAVQRLEAVNALPAPVWVVNAMWTTSARPTESASEASASATATMGIPDLEDPALKLL